MTQINALEPAHRLTLYQFVGADGAGWHVAPTAEQAVAETRAEWLRSALSDPAEADADLALGHAVRVTLEADSEAGLIAALAAHLDTTIGEAGRALGEMR